MKLGEYKLPELPEGYTYVRTNNPTYRGGCHMMRIDAPRSTGLIYFWQVKTGRYEWASPDPDLGLTNWHRVGPKIGQVIIREITKHRLGI